MALHALVDAILGALAEGDIGQHFPPSDPQWKGAPSEKFLAFACERVRARAGAPPAKLDEAVGLARAIDLDVAQAGVVPLAALRPATLLGKGKVDEIAGLVRTLEAGIVVIDGALTRAASTSPSSWSRWVHYRERMALS